MKTNEALEQELEHFLGTHVERDSPAFANIQKAARRLARAAKFDLEAAGYCVVSNKLDDGGEWVPGHILRMLIEHSAHYCRSQITDRDREWAMSVAKDLPLPPANGNER